MHIKQVIIEGFKTYKLKAVIDFCPGFNLILGRNGEGKSNLYDAIQFVLSDKHSGKLEERKALLHEGSGREVLSASVEIIFDNSDRRFVEDKDEISIKRCIGLKKDEYFLDNKHMTKADIVNVLEAAGLSRSNPYYIVEQGQVKRLAHMKDGDRLQELKEIAGTRTYDDRRKESLKIMKDTDKRLESIDEVIASLDKRLGELEDEKKELKEYQTLDSQYRAIEFTIYDKELKAAKEELDSVEAKRKETQLADSDAPKNDVARLRQETEDRLRQIQQSASKAAEQKKSLSAERRKALARKSKAELLLKEEQERAKLSSESKITASKEQATLSKKVTDMQAQLASTSTEYTKLSDEHDAANARLSQIQQKLVDLHAKQGRSTQFANKAQRDTYLKQQVKEIETSLKSKQTQMKELASDTKRLSATIESTDSQVGEKHKEVTALNSQIEAAVTMMKNCQEKRNTAANERKELWKQQEQLNKDAELFRDDLRRAETELRASTDKFTEKGLAFIRDIMERKAVPGVHGPLYQLFTVEKDTFNRAVEVTAGASLFHIVVDDDSIAAKLIQLLSKQKDGGRLTFMPLNQIKMPKVSFPDSSDVFPLITKLKFEQVYKNAMHQVFGKTLVGKTLEVCAEYARTMDMNTITLSGDQVSKKGSITGGFVDAKRSKLALLERIREIKSRFDPAKLAAISKQIERAEQDVTAAMGESTKLEGDRSQVRAKITQLLTEADDLSRQKRLNEQQISSNTRTQHSLEMSVTALTEQAATLKDEMTTELTNKLSAQEESDLHTLTSETETLKKSTIELTAKISKISKEKNSLDSQLTNNLLKRMRELEGILRDASQESGDTLESATTSMAQAVEALKDLDERIAAIDVSVEEYASQDKQLNGKLEELKTDESKQELQQESRSKTLERLIGRRSLLTQKIDDFTRKVRDLGSIPADSSKYSSWDNKKCTKQLEELGNKLKDFRHVNKKALTQFTSFTEQRDDLLVRKEELDKGRKSIIELIESLDQQKDAAIERTFKGIAKHFSAVFSEMVPGGKGTLLIETGDVEVASSEGQSSAEASSKSKAKKAKSAKKPKLSTKGKSKKAAVESESEESGSDESEAEDVDMINPGKVASSKIGLKQYTGIAIKVSFGGVDSMRITQLSGGQQAVVALCLIFAIQRMDPSPFYLFDEIDSNLDAVYRSRLASMISKFSQAKSSDKTAQFFGTTFQPELVSVGDKFYGVSFVNKESRISVISKEEAGLLLDRLAAERKQRGPAVSLD